MEVVFRKLSSADSLTAKPREVYLVPSATGVRGCRGIAKFILENGAKALLRGSGRVETLVIDADPKLDDMLAASFLLQQVERRPDAKAFQVFAEYAADLREGYRPTGFPLENSLEGIFLAIRAGVEKPLTDEAAAKQFLADWKRLEKVIFLLAEEKHDPFEKPLFELGPAGGRTFALRSVNRGNPGMGEAEFAREFVFLAKDMDSYQQDVARGEKWKVQLHGDSGSANGLLLRSPKSLLFKYWTRSPCPPPVGGPYRFLAITWGGGQWAFSTSSKKQISLKPLAESLQKLEAKSLGKEADGSWSTGKPPYVIVGSPPGGSHLTESSVLRAVRDWCGVKSFFRRRKKSHMALLAGGMLFVLALGIFFWQSWKAKRPHLDIHNVYVLSIGVSKYENKKLNSETPEKDADAILKAFKNLGKEGKLCKKVDGETLTNGEATKLAIIEKIMGLRSNQAITSKSLIIITFSGHGNVEKVKVAREVGVNALDEEVGADGYYHFCPHDYDNNKPSTTGIYLTELQRYTESLPCPVVLIFDTCHSGAAHKEVGAHASGVLKSIANSMKKKKDNKGLIVMVACASDQLALGKKKGEDNEGWGHGALTLALLEGIDGRYYYEPKEPKSGLPALPVIPLPKPGDDGFITLKEMDRYVKDRVGTLSTESGSPKNWLQKPETYFNGDITLEEVPISYKAR